MSMQALDADVIRSKLDAIDQSVRALAGVDNVGRERLETDPILAAAVERLLCRIVDLAVETNTHISAAVLGRSPGDYRESFDLAHRAGAVDDALAARLKPSVGMRNAIVHEYVSIDYSIVSSAVPIAIDAYSEYRRQIAAFTVERIKNPSER